MGMFEHYENLENYIPDNRPRCHKHQGLNIMVGETVSHSFEVPFNVNEDTTEIEVIYNVGLHTVIIKSKSELEIEIDKCNRSIITCGLSREESMLFDSTTLDTRVQLRFTMKDNSIKFSEIYPVTVTNSLETEVVPPPTPSIVGFGYTED